MADVVLENVTKIFPNGVRAVRDLNLDVKQGELIVLVGPSGSGKTTTLRLIAGLERPSRGLIRMEGRVVNDLPPQERNVAIVFQRHTLYPHLSVRRNLMVSQDLRRRFFSVLGLFCRPWRGRQERAQAERRLGEVARLLGIEDLLERKPNQLSGGEQQRVALGRALLRQARVLLLDEPLSQLDSPTRAELRRQLHLLHRRLPATMIHVTHDPVEAMILADRVVVLHEGNALQTGPPATVYNRPADRRVAGFFGWPPMNLVDGTLESGVNGLHLLHRDASLLAPDSWRPFAGRPVTLGIRPHDLRLTASRECAQPESAEASITTKVVLLELTGERCLVTLEKGSLRVSGEVQGRPDWKEEESVEVSFDMKRAHLFDGKSGQALVHGRPEG